MKRIKIQDRGFELMLTHEEIMKAVGEMAERMRRDLEGKETLFVCILNGAFMFAADLMKELDLADAEITFLKFASYTGTCSDGKAKELIGLNERVKGRTVVILEDIVDSGVTMARVTEQIVKEGAKEVKIATLLYKPGALKSDIKIDYAGFSIGNEFVVGYGLDYNRMGRNLKDIYKVIDN
jgi:hypoxanthine phosphoribosyltransferase